MARGSVYAVLLLTSACAHMGKDPVRDLADDGAVLYRRGAYAEARETYQAALALRPEDANLLFNLGRCQEKLKRVKDAEKAYRDCLEHDTDHEAARHALAALLWADNRREAAREFIGQWLREHPKSPTPYVEDGWLRLQENDLQNARWRFQQALALDPRNTRALRELGGIYERVSRKDRAMMLYEQSLAVEPNQAEIKEKVAEWKKEGVRAPRPD